MLSINQDILISDIKSYINRYYPVCFTLKDGSSKIATDDFLLKIFHAYVKAGFNIGSEYLRYSPSETRTAWSTPYFMAIRQNMPGYESKFLSSTGYRYRDVIWMVCCAINKRGSEVVNGNRTYPDSYKLWYCMKIEDNPGQVVIETLSQQESRIAAQQQAETQRLERERQAAINQARQAEEIQNTANDNESANIPTPGNDTVKYAAIAAAVIGGFFILK